MRHRLRDDPFHLCLLDYKIARFSSTVSICEVEVYSLSTRSWRNTDFDNIKGVTVEGVIFLYGTRLGVDIMGTDNIDVIISFDLATEVFSVKPLPALLSHSTVELAVYEDKLAVTYHSWTISPQYSSIHFGVMDEGVTGSSVKEMSLSRRYMFDFDPFKLYVGTIWRNQFVYIDYEAEAEMWNAGLYLINLTANER